MSGGLAWMIVAPSENSTIECTIDCGCTTTSMRSSPKPNSRCASITSRPLFTSVAELVVTSGPIRHVGCARACSGVTDCEPVLRPAAERAAARGQHQPFHLGVRPGAQALGDRRVLGVHRHDLPGLGPAGDQRAADDQRLLVRQGEGPAGVERGERGAQAGGAGHAVQHDVAGPCGELAEPRPGRPAPREGVAPGSQPGTLRKILLSTPTRQPGLPRGRPPRPPRRRTREPGSRAGPGCRRRPPAPRRGTAPGCGARYQAPGCRSIRSSPGSPHHEGLAQKSLAHSAPAPPWVRPNEPVRQTRQVPCLADDGLAGGGCPCAPGTGVPQSRRRTLVPTGPARTFLVQPGTSSAARARSAARPHTWPRARALRPRTRSAASGG